jgi:hypothetical protein
MNLHLAEIAKQIAPGAHAAPLPAKCPELNPQVNVWQFLGENWLSNRVFDAYHQIVDHGCDAWNKLIDQPLANHVHRNAGLGLPALIRESWY